jgi:hypothetical protein
VERHWEKKCEAKYKDLEELKTEMKRVGGIMPVMGRLLSDGEVRSLAELKKKVCPKIQIAIKVAAMCERHYVDEM